MDLVLSPRVRRCLLVGKHAGGNVAVATIADDGYDGAALHAFRHAHSNRYCSTTGYAGKDSFLTRQTPRHIKGLIVVYL